jgi:dynein heavy chain
MCEIILSLQPRTGAGGGKSREDIIDELAVDIIQRVPGPYDMEPVQKAYPVVYEESMNTVLQQEIIRYNKLLGRMEDSTKNVRKALVGQMVMTDELDAMSTSMYNQQVPAMWSNVAYPSLKPLAAWVNDLLERLDFLNEWIEHAAPPIFWIPGFFFPQAFLTGTKQNYARKYQVAIDRVSMETQIQSNLDHTSYKTKPEDGCMIYGLFMEGARWNSEKHIVDESLPKELFTKMAPFQLFPKMDFVDPGGSFIKPSEEGYYRIPVYKILTRAGTLSTTGHSTNYVCPLTLPTAKSAQHWIKRGVALFTQLAY